MKWWNENYAYAGSTVYKFKVRLVGDTGITLEKFLIQKKPRQDLLTKIE